MSASVLVADGCLATFLLLHLAMPAALVAFAVAVGCFNFCEYVQED